MADADETASAAESSAADAWFQRKMALHETALHASAKARQAESVKEQKRLERSEEAARRVDRKLEWNRARVSALRARLETAIAPRRAARDARDPTARHKAPPKPVFVSYARDAPFAERALVRAIVDAVNRSAPSTSSSSLCWHDDDDVPFSESRDWKHVQLRRVDAALNCDVLVVIGSPSYERSKACALERLAIRVRREPPEWGGDGDTFAIVAVDAAEACGLVTEKNGVENTSRDEELNQLLNASHFRRLISDETFDVIKTSVANQTETSRMKKRTRAFEDVVAERVKDAVLEKLRDVSGHTYDDEDDAEDYNRQETDVSPKFSTRALADALDALRATSRFAKAESSRDSSDPPRDWSPRRVAEWLRSLGGWTVPFAARFLEEKVHGSILDALDAETLRERFQASDPLVNTALLDAVTRRFKTQSTRETSRKDAGRDGEIDDEIELDFGHEHMSFESSSNDEEGDESTSLMSHASRTKLARLRDATLTALTKKSRGAPSVSEDDAFDALRETAAAFYVRLSASENAKENAKDKDSRELLLHDACLLACCDAFESRVTSVSVANHRLVDASTFAKDAATTLHGEIDDDEKTRRRRATAELDALEELSSASLRDPQLVRSALHLDHIEHVTPLILRAALETKLRARGVGVYIGDEKSDVFFSVVEAKRAVDDVVADGLLAGAGAAGARAAAHFFEKVKQSRATWRVDDCVADMVRVAFARRAKSRVDAAAAAAAARAAALASTRAAIDLRLDAFETSRASDARARALEAYKLRLRVALETVAATADVVSAFRGAARLVETFAATSAVVNGFPSRSRPDANDAEIRDEFLEDERQPSPVVSFGVYAGVLVPGACVSSRALRVVHASASSRRKTGSEIRAWEGNAWPSVGEGKTEGPLSAEPKSSFAPKVVDADDELVVPVFASNDDASHGDDRLAFSSFDVSERGGKSFDGFLSETPDVSETPLGFLALEFDERGEEKSAPTERDTARQRRSVVLLAARAAGVALSRFARARRSDREALRRAAREAFVADEASREAIRARAMEALEEKRMLSAA